MKRNLGKKLMAVVMIFTMAFMYASCGTPSPSDVTKKALDELKKQTADSLLEMAGGEEGILNEIALGDQDEEMTAFLKDTFIPKVLDFDYEILGEEIDGDNATVEVKIQTYKIGDCFTNAITEYISEALALAFGGADEDELTKLFVTKLEGKIDELSEKKYEGTVKLTLTKNDNNWELEEVKDNDEFLNAIFGGMMDSLNSLDNMF